MYVCIYIYIYKITIIRNGTPILISTKIFRSFNQTKIVCSMKFNREYN